MPTLPSGTFFQKFYDIADQFITNPYMSNSECKIIYKDIESYTTSLGNPFAETGTNNFRSGTPNERSYKENIKSDIIRLRVYESSKNWIKSGNIEIKDGRVQVIGFMTDIAKIKRASEIILFSDNPEYGSYKYELASDPFPHSFGRDRYFIAFLDLI
jgi:hypothetical protein